MQCRDIIQLLKDDLDSEKQRLQRVSYDYETCLPMSKRQKQKTTFDWSETIYYVVKNKTTFSFILQEERKAATFAENIDKLEKDINSLKRLHDTGKEDSRWQFYVSMHFLYLTTSLE